MALPTNDGRSLCLASNCQRISADFPRRFTLVPGLETISPQVREILALLTSNHSDDVWAPVYEIRNITKKGLDLSGDRGAQRAAAAVAQGNADVLIEEADRVEILLAHGPHSFHTMRISYLPDELIAARLELIEDCVDVVLERVNKLADLEKKAAIELAARGFKVAAIDTTGALGRVLLYKGPSVQSGLKIELTWIAD
jgi:hypothetical protein